MSRSLCRTEFRGSPGRFTGFIEAHIEQGPVLDDAKEAIGVVDVIVGIRSLQMRITGHQNHAGTTPMQTRRDAFQGLVALADAINTAFVNIVTPATVWTIGHVALQPNASSIVPGQADFTVQWRDGSAERLDRMEEIIRETASRICDERELGLSLSNYVAVPPTEMNASLRGRLEQAATKLAPDKWRVMPSGALHDAANVARLMPAAMLFVPSIGGVSHNFSEDTQVHDLVRGAEVLSLVPATGSSVPAGTSRRPPKARTSRRTTASAVSADSRNCPISTNP